MSRFFVLRVALCGILGVVASSSGLTVTLSNVALSASCIRPHMGETTSLWYTLDSTAHVTVRVRDEQGRLVKTLCSFVSNTAGAHSVAWDGKNSSGAIVANGQYTIGMVASVGPQVVHASEDVEVGWLMDDEDVHVMAAGQEIAAVFAYPGSAVSLVLNGSPIASGTADFHGLFSHPLSRTRARNTLTATATNPITGERTTDRITFPGITNISVLPNPFDPGKGQSAKISYVLPSQMNVGIKVVDGSNQPTTVRNLIGNQVQSSGKHSVTWDGKNDQGKLQCAGRHVVMINADSTLATCMVDSPGPIITDVSVTAADSSSFTVQWKTDVRADSQVEWGDDMDVASSTQLDTGMVTSHSVTVTGLTAGTQCNFRVASCDARGKRSLSGIGVAEASSIPGAPTGLQATSRLRGVALSWTAGGAGTSAYWVYRGKSSGFTCDASTLIGDTASTEYLDEYAVTGTTYYYKIRGWNYNEKYTDPTAAVSACPLSPPTSVVFVEAETAGTSANWTGGWTTVSDPKANGGAYRHSNGGKDCAVEFTVSGPEFTLLTVYTLDGAVVDVYVDGVKESNTVELNSYNSANVYHGEHVISGLANTSHSVKVQYGGPGGGKSGNTYISVDAIVCHTYQ